VRSPQAPPGSAPDHPQPGPSPGFSNKGAKNQKEGPKTRKGRHIFKIQYSVLDVCNNRWAKREMGGTDFKWGFGHHWPSRWRRPCHQRLCNILTTVTSKQIIFETIYHRFLVNNKLFTNTLGGFVHSN